MGAAAINLERKALYEKLFHGLQNRDPETEQKQINEAKKILGGRAYEILIQNTEKDERPPEEKTAGTEFLKFMRNRDEKEWPQCDEHHPGPISLKKLLGPEGKKKYEAAIREEYASEVFCSKVFIASLQKTADGDYLKKNWLKRGVIWVVGPAASGKSTATRAMLAGESELDRVMNENTGQNHEDTPKPGYVAAVDGEIEREASSFRELVKLAAESRGYTGVTDIDTFTFNSKIKNVIKEACDSACLHILMVETSFKKIQMNHYKKEKDTLQPVIRVTDNGNPAAFETTTKIAGKQRAFDLRLRDKFVYKYTEAGQYKPMPKQPNPASKKYWRLQLLSPFSSFAKGKKSARVTVRHAKKLYGDNAIVFDFKNDDIYAVLKKGKWTECESSEKYKKDPGLVRMSKRLFEYYQSNKDSVHETMGWEAGAVPDHNEMQKWVARAKSDPGLGLKHLSEPIIERNITLFLPAEKKDGAKDIEIYQSKSIPEEIAREKLSEYLGKNSGEIAALSITRKLREKEEYVDKKPGVELTLFRIPVTQDTRAIRIFKKPQPVNILAVSKSDSTTLHARSKVVETLNREENYQHLYKFFSELIKEKTADGSKNLLYIPGPGGTKECLAMFHICCEQMGVKLTTEQNPEHRSSPYLVDDVTVEKIRQKLPELTDELMTVKTTPGLP